MLQDIETDEKVRQLPSIQRLALEPLARLLAHHEAFIQRSLPCAASQTLMGAAGKTRGKPLDTHL